MTLNLLHEPTPSRADAARIRLLQAGLQCFADRGLDGVTIRELARVSGQNSAAVTYYFGGKDGLYGAVLDAVMRFFKRHVQPAREEYSAALAAGNIDRDQAVRLLKRIQRSVALGMLTDEQSAQFAMLMVREQNQPSAAFEALYSDTVEPLHRMIADLLARITGDDPLSPQGILRAHAMIGQVQSFIIARETLLRRMGWTGYDAACAAQVADILDENMDHFVAGLKASTQPQPGNLT